jgi:hypothetical protein
LASASASVSASVLASRGPARTSYSITGDEPWISAEQLQDLRYLLGQQDPSNTMDEKHKLPTFRKLPAGCKLGVLVGEGAANVVFEFFLPDGSFMRHRNSRKIFLPRLYPSPPLFGCQTPVNVTVVVTDRCPIP